MLMYCLILSMYLCLCVFQMLEDTRTYYRRKAADRGTLYCACGGITVVATIVFLLIYFS